MKKKGCDKTYADGKKKKNKVWNVKKMRLRVRKKWSSSEEYIIPERKLVIGKNLVFGKMY